MKTANLANESIRQSEVGMVWEEKLSVAGTIEVPKCATFRVRAAGAVTVTIDGILAMTMVSGEIAIFNAGNGDPDAQIANPNKKTVTITTTGSSFVQVARDNNRQKINS